MVSVSRTRSMLGESFPATWQSKIVRNWSRPIDINDRIAETPAQGPKRYSYYIQSIYRLSNIRITLVAYTGGTDD